MKLVLLPLLVACFGLIPARLSGNVSSRPPVVNLGALLTYDSIIGRVAKIAINAAVNDINSDPSILRGTKLVVQMQDSNCSGPGGILEAFQFMTNEVVAIIGPQSSVIAHVISYVANARQIPLLSFAATDPALSSLQYPFFVRITQSDMFQMAAVADIVDYYQWKHITAIFIDDDYGRNGVASLGDKFLERGIKISYKAALPPEATTRDIMDLLIKVSSMESRVIFLHVYVDTGLAVLSVAHHLGMVTNGYAWIATDWLSSLLDTSAPLSSDIMDTMQGVLTLRQHTADSRNKSTFVTNWNKLTKNVSIGNFQLNSYGLYAYDTVWMIAHALDSFFNDNGTILFSNESRLHEAEGGTLLLKEMTLFDGGTLLLSKILKTDFVGVTGHVRLGSDGYLIQPAYDILNVIGTGFRAVGYWSDSFGLSIVPPESLYLKPANVSRQLYDVIWPGETATRPRGWVFPNNGKELRIGVPNKVGYQEFVSVDQSTGRTKGYCIDVFSAAVNLLPYAVSYRFMPFGDGHQNPSYGELVEMVASNVFDAAVGDITIVTNRIKIVDFTQPYIGSGLVILAPVDNQNSNFLAFLRPFTVEMWLVTVVSFLIVGAVVWILEHRINDEFRGPPKKQLCTVFWFSFSTLFFAHKEKTVSTLGRGVLIIWLFVVLIIQSSYTASLTSILTVEQLSSPIKGIDSLIQSKDPIGFQVGSFTDDYLVEAVGIPRSRLKALGSRDEYERALDLGPKNGGVVAIVDERPYIELFLSTRCRFAIVGSEFTKSGWGFALQRDSPLAVDLSTAILSLSENGELQRIHDQWLSINTCSSKSSNLKSDQLHPSNFSGLFLFCGSACVLALLVYFFLMLRQFFRHRPPVDLNPSGEGSSRGRAIQTFLSFVDDKEEDVKHRYKKRKVEIQNTASNRIRMER